MEKSLKHIFDSFDQGSKNWLLINFDLLLKTHSIISYGTTDENHFDLLITNYIKLLDYKFNKSCMSFLHFIYLNLLKNNKESIKSIIKMNLDGIAELYDNDTLLCNNITDIYTTLYNFNKYTDDIYYFLMAINTALHEKMSGNTNNIKLFLNDIIVKEDYDNANLLIKTFFEKIIYIYSIEDKINTLNILTNIVDYYYAKNIKKLLINKNMLYFENINLLNKISNINESHEIIRKNSNNVILEKTKYLDSEMIKNNELQNKMDKIEKHMKLCESEIVFLHTKNTNDITKEYELNNLKEANINLKKELDEYKMLMIKLNSEHTKIKITNIDLVNENQKINNLYKEYNKKYNIKLINLEKQIIDYNNQSIIILLRNRIYKFFGY